MDLKELEKIFDNKSDCYANTDIDIMIPAISKSVFVKTVFDIINDLSDSQPSETGSNCNIQHVSVSACHFTDCLDQYKGECLNGRAWKTCKNRQAEC